jgi:hypothetical protein
MNNQDVKKVLIVKNVMGGHNINIILKHTKKIMEETIKKKYQRISYKKSSLTNSQMGTTEIKKG